MTLPPPARSSASDDTAADLAFAARLIAGLVVVGALLGLVWSWWSPPGPRAVRLKQGYITDETEAFVATDGRYLVLVAIVGLLAGALVWSRVGRRGPIVAGGLVVGTTLGALLTELVGHFTGGGSFRPPFNTVVAHLPVSLHLPGLLFLEPVAAALVYGLFVAFTGPDDLARPDPARAELAQASVGAGDHPQDGGRYGDAPGALQQGDLPPH